MDSSAAPGISGLSVYLPPYRVDLDQWSAWTGNNPAKIRAVVGDSFRLKGPEQSVYSLAATAVLRLIRTYDVDPARIRFLGFGTESSTDNSAGAVIVRGMVNDALRTLDLPTLPRSCEVPEFKHACLGGVYAMKAALRYLAVDGRGDLAIVVASDLAQYELGSTGEQTQGAGAVAMLLESEPRLARLHLDRSGKSSAYRGADFRKPFARFAGSTPGHHGHLNDFPLFNGSYSTLCYLDAVLLAVDDLLARQAEDRAHAYLRELAAVFMHRPYQRMPETGLAAVYLAALARGGDEALDELAEYCALAEESIDAVRRELFARERIAESAAGSAPGDEPFAATQQVIRAFRATEVYRSQIAARLALGADVMAQLGNLYSASLPAWLAAGLADAVQRDLPLDDRELLLIGYGSGDAAEAIPMSLVPGWQQAAAAIDIERALANPIDLSREAYTALHAGIGAAPARALADEFVIERVGKLSTGAFVDEGIEYYRYVP